MRPTWINSSKWEGNIYSDKIGEMRRPVPRKRNVRPPRRGRSELVRAARRSEGRSLPRWVPVACSLTLVVLITVTVNVRAYIELQQEQIQNIDLDQQVQQLTNENLGIQEEIYYLKNDSATIEREAKIYGFVRPRQEEKVSRAGEVEPAERSTNRQTPTRK